MLFPTAGATMKSDKDVQRAEGCSQLLPDVFSLPPEPCGWTLLLSALPAQQHSVHRLEMKHGRGRGASSTFPMPWICAICEADPLPRALPSLCLGKVPVCGALVSRWARAVQTGSLPWLSCQVYPGLIPPMCSPGVGLEEAFASLSPAL